MYFMLCWRKIHVLFSFVLVDVHVDVGIILCTLVHVSRLFITCITLDLLPLAITVLLEFS